jgi:hypothetical protein
MADTIIWPTLSSVIFLIVSSTHFSPDLSTGTSAGGGVCAVSSTLTMEAMATAAIFIERDMDA